jgi:hypothetical protein
MEKKMNKKLVLLLVVFFLAVAGFLLFTRCRPELPVVTPTSTVEITETQKPTEITETPVITAEPTIAPSLTLTATLEPTRTPKPTATVKPAGFRIWIPGDYGGQVWVRSGPSRSSPPLEPNSVFLEGVEVQALRCDRPGNTFADWVQVLGGKFKGYVFGYYVDPYPCR